jgi:hypothetical protein
LFGRLLAKDATLARATKPGTTIALQPLLFLIVRAEDRTPNRAAPSTDKAAPASNDVSTRAFSADPPLGMDLRLADTFAGWATNLDARFGFLGHVERRMI